MPPGRNPSPPSLWVVWERVSLIYPALPSPEHPVQRQLEIATVAMYLPLQVENNLRFKDPDLQKSEKFKYFQLVYSEHFFVYSMLNFYPDRRLKKKFKKLTKSDRFNTIVLFLSPFYY